MSVPIRTVATPSNPEGIPIRRPREQAIDRLRGLAVILMISAHCMVLYQALYQTNDFIWWYRHTASRFAMPLFMMASGYLIARKGRPAWGRIPAIAVAAVITNAISYAVPEMGFGAPNILINFLMALPFYKLIVRFPIEVILVGVLQMYELPITWNQWLGYQPGEVMAFMALGVLLLDRSRTPLLRYGRQLPEWVAVIGRRPLAVYTVHLLVLYAIGITVLAGR